MINIISKEDFDSIVLGDGVAIVDFWAEWCMPCKALLPEYTKLSEQHEDVRFAKCNIEYAMSDILEELKIRSVPTIIVFKDGKEVDRKIGKQPISVYDMMLKKWKA